MIRFEPMTENDCDAVAELGKSCFGKNGWSRELYEIELTFPEKVYYVAKEEKIVGFGGFAQIFDEGHIMNVAVAADHRRQGIASLLLDKLIEEGRKRGVRSFTLEVRKKNAGAIALYEKKGFTLAGERKKYYGDDDALIYWLYL